MIYDSRRKARRCRGMGSIQRLISAKSKYSTATVIDRYTVDCRGEFWGRANGLTAAVFHKIGSRYVTCQLLARAT